ncbi:sulfate reduction electron transfer complex DsrMKJOP subunit DsrM [Desulfobacterales bacterium HSG17]|nr:sulfate reduction electron transfer complex DsrMKJOP subunit DsrM [Desulfobacterales bacterium HSG17]
MNQSYVLSLLAVLVLALLGYIGGSVHALQYVFGIIIPYLAVVIFISGFCLRIIGWAKSPVPFTIPSTCGQQKSLPWIKANCIDNPTTTSGVVLRLALEVLTFRSLFRNTKCTIHDNQKIAYSWEIFLWVAAIAFHYSFFVVIVRHMRFFTEPVPYLIQVLEKLDGFLQVGLPGILLSGFVLFAAVFYLFARRLYLAQVRYISLAQDFFPLFLIMGIALTGLLMRYFTKTDIVSVKAFTMSLINFAPVIQEGAGSIFYIHIFLVSVLLAYFPYSKLMHAGGIFMSPTRNQKTNTRAVRHVNPWNYPVHVHTYDEYEDEFREKMIEAGLPVEKEA